MKQLAQWSNRLVCGHPKCIIITWEVCPPTSHVCVKDTMGPNLGLRRTTTRRKDPPGSMLQKEAQARECWVAPTEDRHRVRVGSQKVRTLKCVWGGGVVMRRGQATTCLTFPSRVSSFQHSGTPFAVCVCTCMSAHKCSISFHSLQTFGPSYLYCYAAFRYRKVCA